MSHSATEHTGCSGWPPRTARTPRVAHRATRQYSGIYGPVPVFCVVRAVPGLQCRQHRLAVRVRELARLAELGLVAKRELLGGGAGGERDVGTAPETRVLRDLGRRAS